MSTAIIPIPTTPPFVGPGTPRVKRKYERQAKRPGQKGYTWTPQQRARFLATAARKRKERNRKSKERRSAAERREDAVDRALAGLRSLPPPSRPSRGALQANTDSPSGRKGHTAGEERSDAIVYLTAATERIAHASDAELLALLALRRLQGRIK